MTRSIAIIGYGRFGRLAASYLKNHFRVFIADTRGNLRVARGIRRVSVQQAATMDTIILAVPIRALPSVLMTIRPFLKRGALVCDISSVKELPVQWMKRILPSYVSILGTHPLFGPQSAAKSLKGKAIVLCPVRISRRALDFIERDLRKEKLTVRRMTPKQHDQLMAGTLFLSHFISRLMKGRDLPPRAPTIPSYSLLLQMVASVKKDSSELFHDMYSFNRFARQTPRHILRSYRRVVGFLAS